MERSREWVLDQLLSAMAHPDPLESLVRRSATVCEGSALVINEHGEVVRGVGAAPRHLIARWAADPWADPRTQPERAADLSDVGTGQTRTVGKWAVHARHVTIRQRPFSIVIAVLAGNRSPGMPAIVLDCLAKLLHSFESLETFALSTRREESTQLLRELLTGVSPGREGAVWRRLEEFGFDGHQPLRIARATVATGDSEASRSPSPVSTDTRLVIETGRARRWTEYTLLFPAHFEAAGLLGDVERAALGVSEPFVALSRIPELLRSADIAHSVAHADNREGVRVRSVDEMRPHTWAAARLNTQYDHSVIARYRSQLAKEPIAWETLRVHIEERAHVPRTAARMNIHENTVRYRLAKLEGVLGASLTDPRTIADIVLALDCAPDAGAPARTAR